MYFVWIVEQAATRTLHSVKVSLFITGTECVYCAVRNESIYKTDAFCFQRFCTRPPRCIIIELYRHIITKGGPGSSVGLANEYGLDGAGSDPGGDEIFRPVQTGPGAHPASCKMGTGSLPVVKCGRGVLLTTHPLLVLWSWKSRAIPLPTLWATPDL